MVADYLSQHHAGFKVSTKRGSGPQAGVFVFANPHTQGFLGDAEFVSDSSDGSVGGVGIGLGVDDKFDSALFKLVGVFDGHVRVSFSIFLPSIKPGA
ncbi:hypothetical protein C627_02235 [Corynebacterium glutamicum ZL-6]|nr:hypothetical protein AC079_02430 [Corynebacterium glutamicum]ANR61435.1 hypothetical protein C628_02235 [[Brevibacterium] flavum ZL-1]ANR64435.1 hypothetical protein C627_02235 [Corynebacterium glutamicum ZL-6]ANU32672.1 hypothetical protein BBD29_02250 [Corynebacterium glutamicum]PST76937.1 hypothetical protein I919_02277 [Corynebacterium glutamicum ZL-2]